MIINITGPSHDSPRGERSNIDDDDDDERSCKIIITTKMIKITLRMMMAMKAAAPENRVRCGLFTAARGPYRGGHRAGPL